MAEKIMLAERLDLPAAAPLMASIPLDGDADVVLDAENVTHLGALCVQVMLVASRTVQKSDRSLSLINANEKVLKQLGYMGLSPELISEVPT